VWFVTLIPAVIIGTHWKGLTGAGWSHVVVAALVILPAYILPLRKTGVPARSLVQAMWLPALAAVPTWWAAHTVATAIDQALLALVLGGLAGTAVYFSIVYPWVRRLLPKRERRRRTPAARIVEHPQPEGTA
jgi:PST family polysaccharide transporter